MVAALVALSGPAAAGAYPDRSTFSDVELTLADRLVEIRQRPTPVVLSPTAADAMTEGVFGPRVKQRVREQARKIQIEARKDGDWAAHDRGLRFAALRRVLFAGGWRTAAEQREIDAARAPAPADIETADDIVELGLAMQAAGYTVGEHSAFGGMCACHSATGYHPQDRAVDVNADGWPGGETAALDALHARLLNNPHIVELLWQTDGHYDHLHVAI